MVCGRVVATAPLHPGRAGVPWASPGLWSRWEADGKTPPDLLHRHVRTYYLNGEKSGILFSTILPPATFRAGTPHVSWIRSTHPRKTLVASRVLVPGVRGGRVPPPRQRRRAGRPAGQTTRRRE